MKKTKYKFVCKMERKKRKLFRKILFKNKNIISIKIIFKRVISKKGENYEHRIKNYYYY